MTSTPPTITTEVSEALEALARQPEDWQYGILHPDGSAQWGYTTLGLPHRQIDLSTDTGRALAARDYVRHVAAKCEGHLAGSVSVELHFVRRRVAVTIDSREELPSIVTTAHTTPSDLETVA